MIYFSLPVESRVYTFCLLCRLLLDISIVQSYEALRAVEDGFLKVLGAIPDTEYEHEVIFLKSQLCPWLS